MFFLLPLLMLTAQAETFKMRNLREQSFTRDNTFCQIKNKRIEIQIRGNQQYTEKKDQYGEHVFWYPQEDDAKALPINQDKLNSYRLFHGPSKICTKSQAYLFGKDQVVLLFLKENRPFKDKLSLQFFDLNTQKPLTVLHTDYSSDLTDEFPGGFIFRTYVERADMDMGKVKIDGVEFTYQDRHFPYWLKATPAGLEVEPIVSFEKFPFKKHFKDDVRFLSGRWMDAL